MQIIFTATLGRNGSQNLIGIFNRFGVGCIGEHEPPDLPLRRLGQTPFFRRRGWFGPGSRTAMIARDFQRRWIAPDELVGRGKALKWVDAGHREKIARLAARRVYRIKRFEKRGYQHYLEAGPYFLRTYGSETHELLPDLCLIKLTRDPLRNAKSFVNRQKDIFRNSLPPDRPSQILRLREWEHLSNFQLYLHQWFETELRFVEFVESHNVEKVFQITTPALSDSTRVHEMFEYFGIRHHPLVGLEPTNTAAEHSKRETLITNADVREYEAMIDLIPARQLERIDYLRNYDPMPG